MKKDLILCDLDGTLADVSHRIHFVRGPGRKDWKSFQADERILLDAPNDWCVEVCKGMVAAGFTVIFVSGRWERSRRVTVEWIEKHTGLKDFTLHMRRDEDFREDSIVKEEILKAHVEKERVLFVLDDRKQVVDMWRRNGLICLQVEEGNY